MAYEVALSTYGAIWRLALPFVRARLRRRMRADPLYVAHAQERFAEQLPAGPFDVWMHAVSVGETRAAEPLIQRWLKEQPDVRILLTHMTPTGRATGRELFGDRITQSYLPYDHPRFVRAFVERTQPRIGVILETELWPQVIASLAARHVPLWLINARLSQKSALGYARWASLTRATLQRFNGILAQAPLDGQRFTALGARAVHITGNLKFDCQVPTMQADGVAALRARLGEHAYWIAGSTREGEEVRLLTALKSHPLRTHLRALIVPRHPQRFDEVYTLAQSLGFRVGRRSTMQPHDSVEVVIGDSMGEMFAYYGVARVAFMGGSLATGSQNLIEPCAVGIPVVLGPSIFNFEAAAQAALAHGAAVQVADETQALDELLRIATQPQEQARMATQATAFCAANRGAIEKTWRFLVQSNASHDYAK